MAINAFVQRLLHAIQSWGIPFASGWVAYEVLGILGVDTRMYAVALVFLMSLFFSRMFASVFEVTALPCAFSARAPCPRPPLVRPSRRR